MIFDILIAIGLCLVVWLWIRASYRLDEKEAEMFRAWRERERERALDDHWLNVYETLPLYDHERRGDFDA